MTQSDAISITNLIDGDVLTYSLAIICGTTKASTLHISCRDASTPSLACRVVNGAFTALYELKPGQNVVRLHSHAESLQSSTAQLLHLVYIPPSSSRPVVRPVYLLASDSDGSFQSPDTNNDLSSGLSRLRIASLMVQSATAELLHEQGLSRRTFALAAPIQHRLPYTLAKLQTLSGNELWERTIASLATERTIDLGILSFSRKHADGRVLAHTALGGGPLALFGGASLWTWPDCIARIDACLSDTRPPPSFLFDDSAGRAAMKGRRMCTATTLGALLHELGHCFTLPHPTGNAAERGGGIMARGFDHFDRIFVESGEKGPFWDRGSAVRLRYHRFLQFDGECEMRRMMAGKRGQSRVANEAAPVFSRDGNGVLRCTSDAGVGHVGYYRNGDNAAHEEFLGNERCEFELPGLKELLAKCGAGSGGEIRISAIDVEGRITEVCMDDL